ncbi:putative uncharacterized protein DDB_G0271606, partial [Ochotona princeps]|uniref:putative uncharacterized protein DDB_G0271606 n=1 Tax=Ochotona princeps TaxID=9978 RepID=UPI002714BC9D
MQPHSSQQEQQHLLHQVELCYPVHQQHLPLQQHQSFQHQHHQDEMQNQEPKPQHEQNQQRICQKPEEEAGVLAHGTPFAEMGRPRWQNQQQQQMVEEPPSKQHPPQQQQDPPEDREAASLMKREKQLGRETAQETSSAQQWQSQQMELLAVTTQLQGQQKQQKQQKQQQHHRRQELHTDPQVLQLDPKQQEPQYHQHLSKRHQPYGQQQAHDTEFACMKPIDQQQEEKDSFTPPVSHGEERRRASRPSLQQPQQVEKHTYDGSVDENYRRLQRHEAAGVSSEKIQHTPSEKGYWVFVPALMNSDDLQQHIQQQLTLQKPRDEQKWQLEAQQQQHIRLQRFQCEMLLLPQQQKQQSSDQPDNSQLSPQQLENDEKHHQQQQVLQPVLTGEDCDSGKQRQNAVHSEHQTQQPPSKGNKSLKGSLKLLISARSTNKRLGMVIIYRSKRKRPLKYRVFMKRVTRHPTLRVKCEVLKEQNGALEQQHRASSGTNEATADHVSRDVNAAVAAEISSSQTYGQTATAAAAAAREIEGLTPEDTSTVQMRLLQDDARALRAEQQK